MTQKTVTSTEFQTRAGVYIDQAAKEPVIITRHNRKVRVLLDIEEYERLKGLDSRRPLYPHELDDEMAQELEKGYQGAPTPELDHLLD